MAFANTNSIAAADMNNLLRGLHRNNADSAHTGDTNETDLASFTVTGGTIGATGRLIVEATGTITGSAGNKTIQMKFGTLVVRTTGSVAGTGEWLIKATISNTATNAQRINVITSSHASTTIIGDYLTGTIDTTANQDIKITGTLANSADTITQTKFEIQVQQIT